MRLSIVLLMIGCGGRVSIGELDPPAKDSSVAVADTAFSMDDTGSDTAAATDTDVDSGSTSPDIPLEPPPSIEPRTVALGFQHACALDGKRVRCWGANARGQLGDGTTSDRSAPVQVIGVSDAIEVAAGGNSSCALTTDGAVLCWGDNRFGQLGELPGTGIRKVLDGASRVSVGADYACAITSGTPRCWGKNSYGALGHAGGISCGTGEVCDPKPTEIKISNAVDIAPGFSSTCALDAASTVRCWGRNQRGQLGDGTTIDRTLPVAVLGFRALSIGVGAAHACAVLRDGKVRCWGANASGRLGYAEPSPMATDPCVLVAVEPQFSALGIEVLNVTEALSVTVGAQHTCARHKDGTLSCWGANMRGELGNGRSTSTGEPCRSIPATLSIASRQVAAGNAFSCMTIASGLYCWGSNLFGQIGDGTTIDRFSPTTVKW